MPYSDDWDETDNAVSQPVSKSSSTAKSHDSSWDDWDNDVNKSSTNQSSNSNNNSGWNTTNNDNQSNSWNSWRSNDNDNNASNNQYSDYSSSKGFGRGARRGFENRRSDFQRVGASSERNFRDGERSDYQRRDNFESNQRNFDNSDKTTIKVQSNEVGRIIGRGGSTIKELQSKSGARIKISQNDADNEGVPIFIFGSDDQRRQAEELINEIIDRSPPNKQQRTYDEPKSSTTSTSTSNQKPANYDFIDWDSAVRESEIATAQKWAALPPVMKEFYFEDPEVSAMHPEDVKAFRLKSNNIMVSCFSEDDERPIPNPVTKFDQAFNHFPEIMREIEKQGFKDPSPIQSQSWPILLQGIDLIGIAQTGTGKTLAYLLPALIHIDQQPTPREERVGPTALILAPTRELAQQIERETKKYTYKGIKAICIYGGGDRKAQINTVGKGVEIVIATPGRLNDLCSNKHIDLTSVSYLVLDEADRMLDMGFEPQIKKVMIDIRPEKQTVMMSATWPAGVQRLAVNYMKDPMQIFVGTLNLAACHSVEQNVILLNQEDKRDFLYNFIANLSESDKIIVFVSKKAMADELSSEFALKSINCQAIHGDRDQSDREQALEDLRTGAVHILIATDVAARGLDINDITHILNFDFPRNVEEYVHRIGRTGRAGRKGESVTLMTRDDWKHAGELIGILVEADQVVPPGLVAMSERYKEWKEKREAELELLGPRAPRRGGFGGGGRFRNNNKW